MKRSLVLLLIAVLFYINKTNGQDIMLNVIAPPPHPVLLSEFADYADHYRVQITNNNPFINHSIIINGRITGNNGIQISFSKNFNDYQLIQVDRGSTRSFTFEELGNFYQNLQESDFSYSGGPDKSYLLQSQRLPDGVYSICLEARDFDTRELLSLPMEANCSNPIVIQSMQPPVIITPLENEFIQQVEPTLINFSWTPVVAPYGQVVYDLKVAELMENVNPYDAIDDINFIQFEQEEILSNTFMFTQAHTPLIPGRQYVARVRARDTRNTINILNNGWSDIITFTFGDPILFPNDNNEQQDIPDANYSCMSPCTPIQFETGTSIPGIQIGDIFRIGHFRLQIYDFNHTINGYSGRGVIKSSDFIPRDLEVNFSDININSDQIITSGIVQAIRNELVEDLPEIETLLSQRGRERDAVLNTFYNRMLDPALDEVSEDLNTLVEGLEGSIKVPLAFGSEYKIHIPDIQFNAQGAQISLISALTLDGDQNTGSKNLFFATDQVCITPGGLTLSEEILKLTMINSIAHQPSDVLTLSLNGSEVENPSYVSVDCDGFNEIILNGYAEFSRDYIKPIKENGTVDQVKKLAVPLHASVTDWNALMFSASGQNYSEEEDVIISPNFEVVQLPGFQFGFENIFVDFSEDQNHENMVFPQGYGNTSNWIGTFLQNLEIKLPSYFEESQNIGLSLSKLLVDEWGVSFDFEAEGIESLADISIGGWGLEIENVALKMLKNELERAQWNGSIEIPICEEPIAFDCSIENDQSQLNYLFAFEETPSLSVPMWGCSFKTDERSRIIGKLKNNQFDLQANLHGEIKLNSNISHINSIKIDKIRFEDMVISNNEPYFQPGNFDIDAVVNAELMGFKIDISDIEIREILENNIAKPTLTLHTGFKFGTKGSQNINQYLNGNTELNLTGKRIPQTGKYILDDVQIEDIEFNSEISFVQCAGTLSIFNNDPTYGDGFDGEVRARFADAFSIESRALFGSVDQYDYWNIGASFQYPQTIPFIGPLGLKGFSGGAFFNMRQQLDATGEIGEINVSYSPSKNRWGFDAGVVWAMMGSESSLNGNAGINVSFRNGMSLESISINGLAKIMDSPSMIQSRIRGSELVLQGTINYNHVQGSLAAEFGYSLDLPKNTNFITGGSLDSSNISFYSEGINNWTLNLGTPRMDGSFRDMLSMNVNLGAKIRGEFVGIKTGVNGYFNLGSNIPPTPPLPPIAASMFGEGRNFNSTPRSGIGMGLHAAFTTGNIGFDVYVASVSLRASAGFGFDASLAHYPNALCNGSPNFGVNNWYFSSRAYVYADARLRLGVFGYSRTIASITAAAAISAAGPHPLYANGKLRFRVRFPVIGTKTFGAGFTMGERCEFTADEDAIDNFLDDLTSFSMLEDLENVPQEEVDFTDRRAHIVARFFKKPNRPNTDRFSDVVIIHKVVQNIRLQTLNNNRWTTIHTTDEINQLLYQSGRADIFINEGTDGSRLLLPGKNYRLVVNARLMIKEGYQGVYEYARHDNGALVESTKQIEFSTSGIADIDFEITSVSPEANQQYYHKGDANWNQSTLEITNETLNNLNRLGEENYELKIVFSKFHSDINILTGDTLMVSVRIPQFGDPRKLLFNVSQLEADTKYMLQLYLNYEGTPRRELYRSTFKTSQYDRLQEKIDATYALRSLSNGPQSNYGSTYIIKFSGNEQYESNYEELSLEYIYNQNKDLTQFHSTRQRLMDFARDKGYLDLVKQTHPEIIPLPLNQNIPMLGNINLGPINLNVDPNRPPIVLKYAWKPNDFIGGLIEYGLQHYGDEIRSKNNHVRDIFLNPYYAMPAIGELTFRLSHLNGNESKLYQVDFN